MAKPFTGTINVDIRDSEPDWTPGSGTRNGKPYVDLEREAVAMMSRE